MEKNFHKNPSYFRKYAVFAADNDIDYYRIGDELSSCVKNTNRTTNILKQNPVCNGYYVVSEIDDVLKSGYNESPLGFDNLDWVLVEVIKLENKKAFYFKTLRKIL